MIKEEAKPHVLLVADAREIREPLARYRRELSAGDHGTGAPPPAR
jgi:hypothetical protein